MNKYEYCSVFAAEIYCYLAEKVAAGFKDYSFRSHLNRFDRFCCLQHITEPVFTHSNVARWMERKTTECSTTFYSRINNIKRFLIYLQMKGYDVVVTKDISFKATDFQPYIYTEEDCLRYFVSIDSYRSRNNKKDAIQYPVLFRILYCCGTRINETLGIRKQDVDLENGIIKLDETKNNHERYVVMGDDLIQLMKQFADKCFYLLAEDDYIFTNSCGKRLDGKTVYDKHRIFLKEANIPYLGNGKGPRIHDWRHHMAVKSFKHLVDSGLDMYVALPILSTYLGHKGIHATEQYVRLTMQLYPYIEEKFCNTVDSIFGRCFYEKD